METFLQLNVREDPENEGPPEGEEQRSLPRGRIVRASDYAADLDAQALLQIARTKARALVERTMQEMEGKRREIEEAARIQIADAEREARERGLEEGLEKSYEIKLRTIDFLENIEKRMIDLVMKSVARVIGEMDQKELLIRVVGQALEKFRGEQELVVRVNPEQVGALEKGLKSLLDKHGRSLRVKAIADPQLQEGDCLLESEVGILDASIPRHLAAMQRSLERLAHSS